MSKHHKRPAVTYPVGKTKNLEKKLKTIWLISGGNIPILITIAYIENNWQNTYLTLPIIWLLAGAYIKPYLQKIQSGNLSFDGEKWELKNQNQPQISQEGKPKINLDAGTYLIIKFTNKTEKKPKWLWAEEKHQPDTWHKFKAVLYAEQKTNKHKN